MANENKHSVEYRVGDDLFDGSDYKILDATNPDKSTGEVADPINRGGTGVVYKVKQVRLNMDRAIKILAPEDEFLKMEGWTSFLKVFDEEKRKLASLNHSNLVKIIDFGRIEKRQFDSRIPYIAMEFIHGKTIEKFIMDDLLDYEDSGKVLMKLFKDVLSALEYLHIQKNAMHSDIKEANIIVRPGIKPEAVLVDIGASHIFDNTYNGDIDTTVFISTKSRVNNEWRELIGQELKKSVLSENKVKLDLYMFGAMLQLFLDKPLPDYRYSKDWQRTVKGNIEECLGHGVEVLDRVASKCLSLSYSSASQILLDLEVINEDFISPLGVPELSIGTNTKSSLALPQDSLPVTDSIIKIINHPTVQRLQGISQLDFVYKIYPGATHSRLSHSIDTYRLTRRYIGNLLGDSLFQVYCGEPNKLRAGLLAGLLHDIGHYPLEHVFEDFAYRRESNEALKNVLRDEEVTSVLLKNNTSKYDFVLNADKEFISKSKRTLRRRVLNLRDTIINIFGSEVLENLQKIFSSDDSNKGILILRSLISGPIDVDKASYLQLDSNFTGVAYGSGVDIDSLLSSLTCFVQNGKAEIAITEKGISAAESIATARRWMFQRVYWHKTNRAVMAMLRYAPLYLILNGHMTFSQYFKNTYCLTDIEAVKWINQEFNSLDFDRDKIENPAQMIINGSRGIYKVLLEYSEIDKDATNTRIRYYFKSCNISEWINISADISEIARTYVDNIKHSDVLVDVPTSRRQDIGEVFVRLFTKLEVKKLTEISATFGDVSESLRDAALSTRIFIHPQLRYELTKGGDFNAFKRDVENYLDEKTTA